MAPFPPQVENEKLFLCHSRNELHIVDSSYENEKPVCESWLEGGICISVHGEGMTAQNQRNILL